MEIARFALADALRPVLVRMPRGASRLYRLMLGKVGSNYQGDPIFRRQLRHRHRVFFDRSIGAFIAVDLADWSCRNHYFRGRYYEEEVPLLIDAWLGSGGVFVDVGANRGIHSLYAARRLAGRGHVHAFEPNPDTVEILRAHLAINHIENCTVHDIGVSDVEGSLTLNILDEHHSGTCSFRPTATPRRSRRVPVKRLDDVIGPIDPATRVLVKIDAEGHEYQVLSGMVRLLEHPELVLICELTDAWLREAGASAEQLFASLQERGYRAYLPSTHSSGAFTGHAARQLRLEPLEKLPTSDRFQCDVVFARRDLAV